jgi:hypothetical protein
MEMAKRMASRTQAEGRRYVTWNCRFQAALCYLELLLLNGDCDEAGDGMIISTAETGTCPRCRRIHRRCCDYE